MTLYTHSEVDLLSEQFYLQQDGALPHYNAAVRTYFNEMFSNC